MFCYLAVGSSNCAHASSLQAFTRIGLDFTIALIQTEKVGGAVMTYNFVLLSFICMLVTQLDFVSHCHSTFEVYSIESVPNFAVKDCENCVSIDS